MRHSRRGIPRVVWTIIPVLLLAAGPAWQEREEAPSLTPENRNYDQKHIRLDLRFDFEGKSVSGSCHVTLSPLLMNPPLCRSIM